MFILYLTIEALLYLLIISLFKHREYYCHDSKVGPSISYDTQTRQVILDGRFVVTTFRHCSLNRSLFEYLYQNPGRRITVEELDNEIFKGRSITLSKVGDAMGFKCELRKVLFTCDGDSITFHPEKLASYNGPLKIM